MPNSWDTQLKTLILLSRSLPELQAYNVATYPD